SDANCTGNEQCIRCGNDSIGTCRPCGTAVDSVCQAGCKRDATFDNECQSPGEAYECPSTGPTADLGKCVKDPNLIDVWCCGGGLANPCARDTSQDLLCSGATSKAYSCGIRDDLSSYGCAPWTPGAQIWCCAT